VISGCRQSRRPTGNCKAARFGAALRTQEAHGLLNRAKALIDETGAKAYEPMMLRMRAQAAD
jgi:hypothetical protein